VVVLVRVHLQVPVRAQAASEECSPQAFGESPEHNPLFQEHWPTFPQLSELVKVVQSLGTPEHSLVDADQLQPALLHNGAWLL